MNRELSEKFPEFKRLAPLGEDVELFEKFDRNRLDQILAHPAEFKPRIRDEVFLRKDFDPFLLAEEYRDLSSPEGIFLNKYEYFNDQKMSRLTSIYPISMQNLVTEIREEIIRGIYDRPDFVNAQPTILNYICEKLDIPHQALSEYVLDRESLLKEICVLNKMDRVKAKKLVISVMNGGYSLFHAVKFKTPWLQLFLKEQALILRRICSHFPAFYKEALRYKLEIGIYYNIEGTCLSTLLSTVENFALLAMIQFYQDQGLVGKTLVLMYDGCYIPKNVMIGKLSSSCEAFVKKTLNIDLKIKFS